MRFVFTWLPCWSEKHHYSGVYRGSKFMHFDKSCAKMSQNHISNLDKVFLNVPPSSDFGLEARILQIGWFYRPKWKKVEKSASKNKHPIKLRFLIWRLQSANPEKKVIPENQGFGSCPLILFNDETSFQLRELLLSSRLYIIVFRRLQIDLEEIQTTDSKWSES